MSQAFANTQESVLQKLECAPDGPETVFRNSYLVTIESGVDGWLIAKCPTLNVVTQGKTQEEVTKNVVDAISMMLEELGKPKEFTIMTKNISSV